MCVFTAAHIAKSKAASALELVAARTFHDPVPTSLADTNVRSLYECRCRSFFSFALGRRLSRVGHPVLFTIQPSVVRRHAADKATCLFTTSAITHGRAIRWACPRNNVRAVRRRAMMQGWIRGNNTLKSPPLKSCECFHTNNCAEIVLADFVFAGRA